MLRGRWTEGVLVATLLLALGGQGVAAPQGDAGSASTELVDPVERAADAAAEAGDTDALVAWRSGLEVSAWSVVDRLLADDRVEAARRVADLPELPTTTGLAAYVAERLERGEDPSASVVRSCEAADEPDDEWDLGALRLARAGADPFVSARARRQLARLARHQGDRAEAARLEGEAAVELERLGALGHARLAWHSAAMNWLRSGELERGRTCLEGELAVAERIGDESAAASACMNLGNVNGQLADYDASLRWFDRAQSEFERLGDRSSAVRVLNNRAFLYWLTGRYRDAGRTYDALLRELPEDAPQRLSVQSRLAELCLTLGDEVRALELAQDALERTPASDLEGRAMRLGVVGRALSESERFEDALAHYRQAEAAYRKVDDPRGEQIAVANRGFLLQRMGRVEESVEVQRLSLELAERLGDALLSINARQNLAEALRLSGELDAAQALQEEALAMAERHMLPKLVRDGHRGLARLHRDQGALPTAARHALIAARKTSELLGGLTSELAARARERHFETFDLALVTAVEIAADETVAEALELSPPALVLELSERSRAASLLLALENRRELRDAHVPEELRQLEERLKEEIEQRRSAFEAALRGETPESDDGDGSRAGSRRVSLKAVRQARAALQDALGRLEEVRGSIRVEASVVSQLLDPEPTSPAELHAALGADQVFVAYHLLESQAFALVVDRADERLVRLAPATEIRATCERLAAGGEDDWATALDRLAELVVEPLELSDAVRRIVVSPDGALVGAPLSPAFGARSVVHVPSASTWLHLRGLDTEPGEGVLALGGPDYTGRRLAALPGAAAEAQAVGTVALVGEDATEAALRDGAARAERWRAIHLACHGVIDAKRPMQSWLALTATDEDDGALSAQEVLDLELRTDLVVLSACDTGRGRFYRGEGLTGLMRSFLFAGSPRVVCSLWKVPDASTTALMKEFHRELAEGASPADALLRAREHVRSQEGWEHPKHWAAWTLWGIE